MFGYIVVANEEKWSTVVVVVMNSVSIPVAWLTVLDVTVVLDGVMEIIEGAGTELLVVVNGLLLVGAVLLLRNTALLLVLIGAVVESVNTLVERVEDGRCRYRTSVTVSVVVPVVMVSRAFSEYLASAVRVKVYIQNSDQ